MNQSVNQSNLWRVQHHNSFFGHLLHRSIGGGFNQSSLSWAEAVLCKFYYDSTTWLCFLLSIIWCYLCCHVVVSRFARCSGTLAKRARYQARHDAQRCSLFLFICYVNCSSATSSFHSSISTYKLRSFERGNNVALCLSHCSSCFLPWSISTGIVLSTCCTAICYQLLQLLWRPMIFSICSSRFFIIDRSLDRWFILYDCHVISWMIEFILHPYR